jgi:hypothetical protein
MNNYDKIYLFNGVEQEGVRFSSFIIRDFYKCAVSER